MAPRAEAPEVADAHVVTSDLPTDSAAPADAGATPTTEKPAGNGAAAPSSQKDGAQEPSGDKPAADANANANGTKPEDDDATRRRNDPEKRIARLTRNWRDSERRAGRLEGENAELRRQLAERNPQRPTSDTPAAGSNAKPAAAEKPKPEDFDSYEQYGEAYAEWKASQGMTPAAPRADSAKPAAPAKADDAQTSEQPRPRQMSAVEQKAITDARTKFSDFDEVMDGFMVTDAMVEAIVDEPNSAEIFYHLAQDEAEYARIRALTSPRQQTREVWRFAEGLKARLASSETSPTTANGAKPANGAQPGGDKPNGNGSKHEPQASTPPKAAVSKASPVMEPLAGGASPTNVDLEGLDPDEYCRVMDERDRKAGRSLY